MVQPLLWRSLADRAVSLVLPHRCAGCGVVVSQAGSLCTACWPSLRQIGPPQCDQCGDPFEIDPGPGSLCAACIAAPPPWSQARAAFAYDGAARTALLGFKHADRDEAVTFLAGPMARAGAALLADPKAILAPVPLHRWRLFGRTYNQAALLAQAIAALAGRTVAVDLLERVRATPSQQGLDRAERARNMRKAFRVRRPLAGETIVLVDDVLTTGATAAACTQALKKAGAGPVHVLTAARVLRSD
jgi:ComF family protein